MFLIPVDVFPVLISSASLGFPSSLKRNKRSCEIARSNANDAKAEKHQNDRPESSYRCNRVVITVANGGNGDESPPDGIWIGGDICVRITLFSFKNEPTDSENKDESNYKGKEQGILRETVCQHFSKVIAF